MSFDSQSNFEGFALYQSHKQVRAAKIKVVYSPTCVGVEPNGLSVTFDPANKPVPQVGNYVVFYPDGYISFSPTAAFEDGYSRVAD